MFDWVTLFNRATYVYLIASKSVFPTEPLRNTRWHCDDECDFFLSRPVRGYKVIRLIGRMQGT